MVRNERNGSRRLEIYVITYIIFDGLIASNQRTSSPVVTPFPLVQFTRLHDNSIYTSSQKL